jgi:hypothetical protein
MVDHIADGLWQRVMHLMWHGRCAKCNSTYGCSGHHIIKRSFQYSRYAVLNGILLCQEHHAWAEEYGDEFLGWLNTKYPKCYEFYEKYRNPPVFTWFKFKQKEMRKHLRQLIKELE